jgi:hypothetical protein
MTEQPKSQTIFTFKSLLDQNAQKPCISYDNSKSTLLSAKHCPLTLLLLSTQLYGMILRICI